MPGAGQVTARIVHASADAPTVGIDVGADDPTAPEVAALDRFADTGAAGVALPAGPPLGPPPPPLGDLPRQATGFSLMAVGPTGLVGTIAQDPTVFALHASPDAPAVDIREATSDALLIDNLAFGQLERVQVPPGDYTLDFYAPPPPPASATWRWRPASCPGRPLP